MANNTVLTEFLLNGTWQSSYSGTNLTERVRYASPGGGIEITRGITDQASGQTAQTSDFTLNNRDGLFNNRNPLSPLYKMIPRNTQVRHSIYPAGGSREGVLKSFFPADGQGVILSTADKASLDVTGDLELRFEITPYSWHPQKPMNIVGKYLTTGNQRAWLVYLNQDGSISIRWSPDGTFASARVHTISNALMVAAGLTENVGRAAIKVLFDVDNGAAGTTSTWSWSSTGITGTYTAIGSFVQAGTTSFFASTADLEIGNGNNGGNPVAGNTAYVGRFHAFRLYSGLTSTTLVANMDATAQAPNSTTWSDGLAAPNTWTKGTNPYCRMTSDQIRFHGELTALPIEWDTSGKDVFVNTRALGTLGRLTQTGQPVQSPMRRYYGGFATPTAYWPAEAQSGATQIDSATPGTSTQLSNVTFTGSTPTGLAGSAGTATLVDITSFVKLYKYGDTPTGSMAQSITFRLTALPAAATSFALFGFQGSSLKTFELKVGAGGYTMNAYNQDGSVAFTNSTGFGTGANPITNWITFQTGLVQEGGNIRLYTAWGAAGSAIVYTDTVGGTAFAGTTGIPTYTGVSATQDAAFAGAQINHLLMTRNANSVMNQAVSFTQVAGGFDTERAGRRLLRQATEQGVTLDLIGDPDETPQMGPQLIDTFVNNLQNASELDGGVLAECRDQRGFVYVTALALGDSSAFSISYTDGTIQQPLKPTDDNRYLANDVTASSPRGTTSNYALAAGTNSIQDPPNGVGRVTIGITRNAVDAYLDHCAQWEVFWRTWDELRWPNITVHMNRTKLTTDSARYRNVYALDVGSALLLSSLPVFASYDLAYLSLFGYMEQLDQFEWKITFNAVARGPYESRLLLTSLDTEAPVMDSADAQSLLNAGVTSTATSMDVKVVGGVASGRRWSTAASVGSPIDALLAGERLTVTAVSAGAASGSDWVQTLTVTRSVNGVIKAQSISAEFRLNRPDYISLGV